MESKSIILALVLALAIAVPCFGDGYEMYNKELMIVDKPDLSDTGTISGYVPANSITFDLGDGELEFTWEDGIFKVKYPEGKLDEAGKVFVKWLEDYMDKATYCGCDE